MTSIDPQDVTSIAKYLIDLYGWTFLADNNIDERKVWNIVRSNIPGVYDDSCIDSIKSTCIDVINRLTSSPFFCRSSYAYLANSIIRKFIYPQSNSYIERRPLHNPRTFSQSGLYLLFYHMPAFHTTL